MWKLVIEDDEGKRTVVPLTRDDYTIGRKEGNTIRLTERNVSRTHAKIRKLTNGAAGPATHYVLEDNSSYNGVYVNGIRVAQSHELSHGDLIQIGDYRIVLQDDAVIDAPPPSQPSMKTTQPSGGQRASLLMERPTESCWRGRRRAPSSRSKGSGSRSGAPKRRQSRSTTTRCRACTARCTRSATGASRSSTRARRTACA